MKNPNKIADDDLVTVSFKVRKTLLQQFYTAHISGKDATLSKVLRDLIRESLRPKISNYSNFVKEFEKERQIPVEYPVDPARKYSGFLAGILRNSFYEKWWKEKNHKKY